MAPSWPRGGRHFQVGSGMGQFGEKNIENKKITGSLFLSLSLSLVRNAHGHYKRFACLSATVPSGHQWSELVTLGSASLPVW